MCVPWGFNMFIRSMYEDDDELTADMTDSEYFTEDEEYDSDLECDEDIDYDDMMIIATPDTSEWGDDVDELPSMDDLLSL